MMPGEETKARPRGLSGSRFIEEPTGPTDGVDGPSTSQSTSPSTSRGSPNSVQVDSTHATSTSQISGHVKSHTMPRLGPGATSSTPSSPPGSSAYAQPESAVAGPSSLSSFRLLSHHLEKHPNDTAAQAVQTMFPKPNPVRRLARRFKVKHSVISGLTKKEMKRWTAEGEVLRKKAGWKLKGEELEGRTEVGDLFWKMYLSLMPTLERDPLSGLVPPDLLGSTTTMPLSVLSLIPDIIQHYRDVMIRAEKEIFLATNYWQPSNSVTTVSQVLRDLSALVIKEGRPKVVVKIMYDRGSWEQLWNAHAFVKEEEWEPLHLPRPDEVEGLELEIINFHRVLLGTFHAKFLVVDRKVALLNSNNIQDRPNLELMTHFEGPVVDAFYEIALQSWYNRLEPPLPCMSTPYQPPRDAEGNIRYLFADHNPYFDEIEVLKAARAARSLLRRQTQDIDAERALHEEAGRERFRNTVRHAVDRQRQSFADWRPGEEINLRAHVAMNELRDFRDRWTAGMGIGSRAGSRAGSRPGSRPNSRGPSRRPSANDTNVRAGHLADSRTAATTAHNATLDYPVDPQSSHLEPSAKAKSQTMPPAVNADARSGNSLMVPGSSREASPRPSSDRRRDGAHVAFINTRGGVFDSDVVDSPIGSARPSPILSKRSLPVDLAVDNTEVLVDSPTASTLDLNGGPKSDDHANAEHVPENANGEPLPATAQMPSEIQQSSAEKPEDAEQNGQADGRPEMKREDTEPLPEGTGSKRLFQLSKKFNDTGVLSEAWATVEDSDELDNFRPHVIHAPHEPFPIAMCCRKPHGFPGHHDIRNPQNAAWLAGFRYAQKRVFIQSPTLNARPILRAIKQTCRRGVDVVLLLDLGFNDKGESIPFQGGTNEEVVDRVYKSLRKEGKEKYLKVYWYTGKDQVRPLNAVKKQRNCHIKFAAYDDEVLILGNGNQDSQSWFHSQEVNVMIDSKQICAEMMDTLLSNQNTMQYGLVGEDGQWRDKEGKTLTDYGLTEKGAFRGLSAFIRFAKSV